ncbi:MAG: hypothetical protein KDB53_06730 [Planctomycetes bacterium]|nr:hypothetical protein [Planctomycetota bacterium]
MMPQSTVADRPLAMPGWDVTSEAPLGLWETLRRSGDFLARHLQELVPGQTAAFWLGLITMIVVGFDTKRLVTRRIVFLTLQFIPALLVFDLDRQGSQFHDVVAWSRFGHLTLLLMLIQVVTVLWALSIRIRKQVDHEPVIGRPLLRLVALLFLLLSCGAAIESQGADSSIYTNWGAQRLRERGLLPYGDPWLRQGTATAYGPAIYLMLIPAQVLTYPEALNPPVDLPESYAFSRGLPVRATICVLLIIGFFGLVALGRKLGDRRTGWALAALVFSSPFVLGIGGPGSTVAGAGNISDTAPFVFLVLAFLWLERRPALAGLSLAQATAAGFFPLLIVPPMLIWLKGRGNGVLRFLTAYAVLGAAYLAWVLMFTETPQDGSKSALTVFMDCTFGVQTRANDPANQLVGYGDSPFGFWGSHPDWRDAFLGRPGAAETVWWGHLTLLVLVAFATLRARGRSFAGLLMVCGAVVLGFQLLRTHASGTHLMWAIPLLIGPLLARRASVAVTDAATTTA